MKIKDHHHKQNDDVETEKKTQSIIVIFKY